MKLSLFSLLAAVALNALVCHAAEAQCALADVRFEVVPDHRRMMKRTFGSAIRSMALAPVKHAGKPLVSAMRKVRKAPSRQAVTQQGASVADDLKHVTASTKGVEDAFSIQQSRLLDAEGKLIQANKELKNLRQAGANVDEIEKAQKAKDAASAAVKVEQTELTNLGRRLNSAVRVQAELAKGTRKVKFQTGPPQIFDEVLTKAEQDMVEAQLKAKELATKLEDAKLTLLLSTPAAKKSITALATQSKKVDDLEEAFQKASENLRKLENDGANSGAIAQAAKAEKAAEKSLEAAKSKLQQVSKQVDPSVMKIIGKHDGIAFQNAKIASEGDRLLDPISADASKLEILALENAESVRGVLAKFEPSTIASTNVVRKSVAEADVKRLTLELDQATKKVDEATEVVRQQGGNTKVLVTSAVKNRLKPLTTAEDDLLNFQLGLRRLELENARKIKAGQQPDLNAVEELVEGMEDAAKVITSFGAQPKSLKQAVAAAENALTESQSSLNALVKSNADPVQIKAAEEAVAKASKKVQDVNTALGE